MKKILLVCVLLLALIGCGGEKPVVQKKPEETQKILDDLSAKVLFSFYTDNYYDAELNCYDKAGKPSNCYLVTMEPSMNPYATVSFNDFEFFINGNMLSDKYIGISGAYYNDDSPFNYSYLNDDGEIIYEAFSQKCVYTAGGKENPADEHCTGDDLEEAKEYVQKIDDYFKKLGLTKEDLEDYFRWYIDEKLQTVKEAVWKAYEEDKE